jgi:mannose-6-phosphate isomerase-like protein (cupin superfamily)
MTQSQISPHQNQNALAANLWNSTALLDQAAHLIPRAQTEGGAASIRLAEFPRHYAELSFRCSSGIGELHSHFADTFFILAGSATLITGGELIEARAVDPGEARGTAITGTTSQQLTAGAVVHIPAGLAHQMILSADESITYFVLKIQESEPV